MNRSAALTYLVAIFLVIALVSSELRHKDREEAIIKDFVAFKAAGKRFPLHYGLGMCERIRWLETRSGRPDAIGCDAMRHEASRQ